MESSQWVNRSQPQMLVTATIWLYIRAVFGVLFGISLFGLVFAGGYAAAGFGIANEKRWGHRLGIAITGLVCLVALANLLTIVRIPYFSNSTGFAIISLMFDVALFSMLVHPSSRSYAKIWFS
jgi:hypothetical protein